MAPRGAGRSGEPCCTSLVWPCTSCCHLLLPSVVTSAISYHLYHFMLNRVHVHSPCPPMHASEAHWGSPPFPCCALPRSAPDSCPDMVARPPHLLYLLSCHAQAPLVAVCPEAPAVHLGVGLVTAFASLLPRPSMLGTPPARSPTLPPLSIYLSCPFLAHLSCCGNAG